LMKARSPGRRMKNPPTAAAPSLHTTTPT
jgi:hypothetical protein